MAESQIITSQYVQIDQTPAGIGERIFARALDYVIMFVYSLGFLYFFEESNFYKVFKGDNELVLMVIVFIPVIFYSFLWETFNRGRSPGKMAFGMRVVMRDGTTPTVGAYIMRWILLLIDTWTWVGVIVIALTKNNQRFGDLAAGTIVIKEKNYHHIQVSLDEYNYLTRGYNPVFPQAENLSLEQINLINETLTRNDSARYQRINALAIKVKDFLKITPSLDDELFLRTLTRDYQYYALEEI